VGREDAYVIDPGPELPGFQTLLAVWLRDHAHRVQGILLSHGHPDHAPGAAVLKRLLDVPVWAPTTVSAEVAEALDVDRRFGDGDRFPVDHDALQAVATPGHTPEHTAFWLVGARILFSADLILGQGTTLVAPPEGDMVLYMQSLEAVRKLRSRLIAPGHGPLIYYPDAKIDEYVRHRREREQQILRALNQGPASVEEIVRRVYVDVDPRLHGLAEGSVRAQLAKLLHEGKVRQTGDVFTSS
jgi:hydroxyacylglutathione hydrolase